MPTSSHRLPRHSETARDGKKSHARPSKRHDDFETVSIHINDAIDQLAAMASDFFADRERIPALDETALTLDSSDESEGLILPLESLSMQSPTQSFELPESLDARQAIQASPDAVFRPLPASPAVTPTRVAPSPKKRANSLVHRSSPMARMRNVEVRDAAFLPPVHTSSPPRKTGDQVIQDKHAKWRRQIQRAKQREEQLKQQHQQQQQQVAAGCVAINPRSQPGKILEQLLRSAACGVDLDDSISPADSYSAGDSYSSDSSEDRVVPQQIEKGVRRNGKLVSPSRNGHAKAKALALEGPAQLSSPLLSEHSSQMASHVSSAVSVTDKNFIKAFIHEASHEGIPMIWHHASNSDPHQTLVFIESGFIQEDGDYAGPRLSWYSQEGEPLGAVDLLDIESLESATPLQLQDYPFAIPRNSLILRLHNKVGTDLVLELLNSEEARRFIHGLRWVVARMAFNMIIGNPTVSCELLDVSPAMEVSSRAMNAVTSQMIDKVLFQSSSSTNQLM